jgi:hypothetical protein
MTYLSNGAQSGRTGLVTRSNSKQANNFVAAVEILELR